MKSLPRALLLFLVGCDSIVSGPCDPGYVLAGAQCIDRGAPDAGMTPDAPEDGQSVVTATDASVVDTAMIDGPGCTADVTSDPDNCGACGHVCASGICTASQCAGEPRGHIVAIGHDYRQHHAVGARVLGNAATLGRSFDLGIAWWPGASPSHAKVVSALTTSLQAKSRPWHVQPFAATPSPAAFTSIDVLIVDPQQGDGGALETEATAWAGAIDSFVRNGGVVVVLEGEGSTSHRFAAGAGLFTVGAPVAVTGSYALVVDPSDALADQVSSPYLAEMTSVSFPQATEPVVSTSGGDVIVFHLTR
jgi:hypothetical protein